jgi:FtsP/CotA-like multicopper oxidase with cupredoxin domain
MSHKRSNFTRRDMLKLFGVGGASTLVGGKALANLCPTDPPLFQVHQVENFNCDVGAELMPMSPFIVEPYKDPLPVPRTQRPGWTTLDGTTLPVDHPDAWTVRVKDGVAQSAKSVPGPDAGAQDALGERPTAHGELFANGLPPKGTHQLFPGRAPGWVTFNAQEQAAFDKLDASALSTASQKPKLYHIRLKLGLHRFTSSPVMPLNPDGTERIGLPPGAPPSIALAGTNRYLLPPSLIYGFNGAFPGAMVNVEYGKPVILRFENDLDHNPDCIDRMNFGAPDWAFLTHLHNGHSSPESDGNPHHLTDNEGGYQPGEWMDNLYLMYPAGGLEEQKQSFLWFHDHRMHHTAANVYKGMVGLMPHYDPQPVPGFPQGRDPGDERVGLRLPGVRMNHPDGSFDVEYDIPLALYDVAFDDGATPGSDMHTPTSAEAPTGWPANNLCGQIHPEWWGRHFLRHYPNHGYVFDVHTVNCKAYPVLDVRRRKYRFRFLGASLARCYNLSIRKGTPLPFPGQSGQWNFGQLSRATGGFGLPGAATKVRNTGEQAFKMMQIATDGGLLPVPIERDSVEIWPAKRREVIIDFTKYMDGSPTTTGDVVYLCNTMEMPTGRKPILPGEVGGTPNYCVPLMKIVIGDPAPDNSLMPVAAVTSLRPMAPLGPVLGTVPHRQFILSKGGGAPGPETEWLINNLEFDPLSPLAFPRVGTFETWDTTNGGGGWTHPMHMHEEEHRVISRTFPDPVRKPDDIGREDLTNLDPGESVVFYRGFRTFLGNYVAHCHNLAHEDHNMMFGWTISPPA